MYQRPKSSDCLVISVGRSGISVSFDIRDMFLPFYVVAIGKVRAKVAAAALLAAQRRARDQEPDGHDAAYAAEVAVGQSRRRRGADERVPRLEARDRLLHSPSVTHEPAVRPHHSAHIVCGRWFDRRWTERGRRVADDV